ncbi:SDR family NAD(P)-dependent oxidoreductase [Pontibacter rufus]|uniref:SDR family NAD(P)-dependent oxidoreductase n=1 Tax=Pontibacter rufus TaxID=2791028 RepID=UPI00351C3C1C
MVLYCGLARNGGRAEAFAADVSSEAGVCELFKAANSMGRLSTLVNNAGIQERQMRVESMEAGRLHHLFSSNVVRCFPCSKEAIKRTSVRHGGAGGTIVNVSSIAALIGAPGEYVVNPRPKVRCSSLCLAFPGKWRRKVSDRVKVKKPYVTTAC